MKPCISYCLIGAALLGSMIMTMMASKKSKNFKNFMSILDENQRHIYKSIIKERMNNYIQGLIIGVILAILVTYGAIMLKPYTHLCIYNRCFRL